MKVLNVVGDQISVSLSRKDGDFLLPVAICTEEYNLLNFVATVQNKSFQSYVEGVFKSIYDFASLSVSLTGMTLDEAIVDWNNSKAVQDHPELFVHIV